MTNNCFLLLTTDHESIKIYDFVMENNATLYILEESFEASKNKNLFKKVPQVSFVNLDKYNFSHFIVRSGYRVNQLIYEYSVAHKIPIITSPELFQLYRDTPVVLITGSTGKSTTISFIYQLFKNIFDEKQISNLFVSESNLLEFNNKFIFDVPKDAPIIFLESSSSQLKYCHKFQAFIYIILNLSADHIDYHDGIENYYNDKLKLLKNLTYSDFCIFNIDNSVIRDWISSQKLQTNLIGFSGKSQGEKILQPIFGSYYCPEFMMGNIVASFFCVSIIMWGVTIDQTYKYGFILSKYGYTFLGNDNRKFFSKTAANKRITNLDIRTVLRVNQGLFIILSRTIVREIVKSINSKSALGKNSYIYPLSFEILNNNIAKYNLNELFCESKYVPSRVFFLEKFNPVSSRTIIKKINNNSCFIKKEKSYLIKFIKHLNQPMRHGRFEFFPFYHFDLINNIISLNDEATILGLNEVLNQYNSVVCIIWGRGKEYLSHNRTDQMLQSDKIKKIFYHELSWPILDGQEFNKIDEIIKYYNNRSLPECFYFFSRGTMIIPEFNREYGHNFIQLNQFINIMRKNKLEKQIDYWGNKIFLDYPQDQLFLKSRYESFEQFVNHIEVDIDNVPKAIKQIFDQKNIFSTMGYLKNKFKVLDENKYKTFWPQKLINKYFLKRQ